MVRILAYLWVLPVSLLGLLVAMLARGSGGTLRRVDGVLETAGGWPEKILTHGFPFSGPVAAITLGHVVVGKTSAVLDATRLHERAHVRQFEKWGIFLLVAYPLAGLYAWIKGGNPYHDNWFERQARAAELGSNVLTTRL